MTDQQVTTKVDEAAAAAVPQQVEAPEQRPSEPDPVAAAAVDLARRAAEEVAQPGTVGRHLSVSVDSSGLTMHAFDSTAKGYRGWRWAVTLAHVPGSDRVTVCDTVLLPGAESILAPDWVPWSDRLAPGDLGAGDELPFKLEDPYLVPGYTVTDESDEDQELFWELGLGRERVLGPEGVTAAADRWHRGPHGPTAEIAIQASASCVTCAYFVPLSGVMRQAFGACANEWSPADGSVVTADFGCGAHSETDLEMPAPEPLGDHILDETVVDRMDLEVVETAAPGPGLETGSTTEVLSTEVLSTEVLEETEVVADASGDFEVSQTVQVRDAGGTRADVVPAESAPPVAIEVEPTLDPEPVASPEDVITVRPLGETPDQQTESVESARTATDEMIQGGVVSSETETGAGAGPAEVEAVEIEVVRVEVAQAAPGGEAVRPEPEAELVPPPALNPEIAEEQPESAPAGSSTEAALGEAVEPVSEYTETVETGADAAVLSEGLAVPGETVLESDGVLASAVDHIESGEVQAGDTPSGEVEGVAAEPDSAREGAADDQDEPASDGEADGSRTIAIDSAVAAAEPDPVAQPVVEASQAGEVNAPSELSGGAEPEFPAEELDQDEVPGEAPDESSAAGQGVIPDVAQGEGSQGESSDEDTAPGGEGKPETGVPSSS